MILLRCSRRFLYSQHFVHVEITDEALALFYNLDNRKAIGIASNNLGNVLLTIGKSMGTQHEDFGALEYQEVRVKDRALQLFNEAVEVAKEEYENASEESKSEYCQQVCNPRLIQTHSMQELTRVSFAFLLQACESSFQQRCIPSRSLALFEREKFRISRYSLCQEIRK